MRFWKLFMLSTGRGKKERMVLPTYKNAILKNRSETLENEIYT
jgi:hypothetical protein